MNLDVVVHALQAVLAIRDEHGPLGGLRAPLLGYPCRRCCAPSKHAASTFSISCAAFSLTPQLRARCCAAAATAFRRAPSTRMASTSAAVGHTITHTTTARCQ